MITDEILSYLEKIQETSERIEQYYALLPIQGKNESIFVFKNPA